MKNQQLAGKEVGNAKAPADSNLIHLEGEVKQANRAKDINTKINLLESSLSDLQSELDTINRSVDEGLERLSDSDLDLTSKVSETYRRLGEIDKTYKTLSGISSDIDTEVKKLTSEISEVAAQSATELEKLEVNSSAHNTQLNEQHQHLVARVDELVRHSAETNAQLSHSIEHNTDALLKLEKQLVTEIGLLADVTQERDDELASNLSEAEKEIERSKARILQMQKVDVALDQRATLLEISSAELASKSRQMDSSIELLSVQTKDLLRSVDKLQQASTRHTSLIFALQSNVVQMTRTITALTGTETKHFRMLSGAFIVALLAIASLYFLQSNEFQKMAGLQQDNLESGLGLVALNEQLKDEVNVLNGKLVTMGDQVESMDGRINRISPFSRFGKNSVIHGPQWISEQSANNLVIQIATVSNKDQLYEIAQRYNYYFKDEMSYFTVTAGQEEKYVLVYGNFIDANKASAVIRSMPRYFNFQRPQIKSLGDIQKLIAT